MPSVTLRRVTAVPIVLSPVTGRFAARSAIDILLQCESIT